MNSTAHRKCQREIFKISTKNKIVRIIYYCFLQFYYGYDELAIK